MFRPTRGQGGYLVFLISPKNASLVEDVLILLPVKFCWGREGGEAYPPVTIISLSRVVT